MNTLILDPVKEMLGYIASQVPTIVGVMLILVIGYILARVVSQLIHTILKEIHFDKLAHTLGINTVLNKGGIKDSPVDMVRTLVYWIIMIMGTILGVKSMGLTVVDDSVHRLFSYVPNVISGVFVLVFGMILAKFISRIIVLVAGNTDMPKPEILGTLSKWAIILFAFIIFMEELGLSSLLEGTHFNYLFGAICLALALSFGLGGRDSASKFLDKLKK